MFVEREIFNHKCKRKKFLRLSLIKKQNFLLIHVLRQVNAMSFCSIVFIANLGIPINTIEQKHTTFILIDLLLKAANLLISSPQVKGRESFLGYLSHLAKSSASLGKGWVRSTKPHKGCTVRLGYQVQPNWRCLGKRVN